MTVDASSDKGEGGDADADEEERERSARRKKRRKSASEGASSSSAVVANADEHRAEKKAKISADVPPPPMKREKVNGEEGELEEDPDDRWRPMDESEEEESGALPPRAEAEPRSPMPRTNGVSEKKPPMALIKSVDPDEEVVVEMVDDGGDPELAERRAKLAALNSETNELTAQYRKIKRQIVEQKNSLQDYENSMQEHLGKLQRALQNSLSEKQTLKLEVIDAKSALDASSARKLTMSTELVSLTKKAQAMRSNVIEQLAYAEDVQAQHDEQMKVHWNMIAGMVK